MGKRADISNEKKSVILALIKTGKFSFRQIALNEGVSIGTVAKINQLFKENKENIPSNRQNCRGVRKTTSRTDRRIISTLCAHRTLSYKDILKLLEEDDLKISETTLRRRSKEAGFCCRRPVKKPILSTKMKKDRLEFAKTFRSLTAHDWEKIFFSDESNLQAVTRESLFIRRRKNEKYHECCMQLTARHPLSVMIWSGISGKGPGPVYFVEGTMRKEQYLKVLNDIMLPYLRRIQESNSFTFMQDKAPCHTAKIIQEFFSSKNIPVLPWPGNSPDLNPIENVWHLLKTLVYKRKNSNLEELKKNIKEIWETSEILKDCITKCIESMPKRIAEVIKRKGGITKF